MKKICSALLAVILMSTMTAFAAEDTKISPVPDSAIIDNFSDTWTAVDFMGRKLADYEETGPVKEGRHDVAMFYHNWHGGGYVADVIPEVIAQYPEAKEQYFHEGWMGPHNGFWGESIYGFYKTNDFWHNRKAAELMADAGVDVIFLDYTNQGNVFENELIALADSYQEARRNGCDVPKISFFMPMGGASAGTFEMVKKVYNIFYKDGKYQDLWYYLDGKPMFVAGGGEKIFDMAPSGDEAIADEMRAFFTVRGTSGRNVKVSDGWFWLVTYPQGEFGKTADGRVEMVNVGAAVNMSYKHKDAAWWVFSEPYTMGRSYSEAFGEDLRPGAMHEGYFFKEQASRVLSVDPAVAFVTGWNEWVVAKQFTFELDQTIQNAFIDLFDDEHSRDFEPSKGALKDVYYNLLTDFIRRYKGTRPAPVASEKVTIDINGDLSVWESVKPDFINDDNSYERDADGYLDRNREIYHYTTEVVNAISKAKVARDDETLYFYVECLENIETGNSGFMNLWINADRSYVTGWEGYEFVVNMEGEGELSALNSDFTTSTLGSVEYEINGKVMIVKIPRNLIGETDKVELEFKWTDNIEPNGDLMLFYTEGSAAPVGRYNYLFTEIQQTALTAEEREKLFETTVVKADSGKIIVNGAKMNVYEKDARVKTYEANGTVYIPMSVVEDVMGWGRTKVFYDATENAMFVYTHDLENFEIINNEWAWTEIGTNVSYYDGYLELDLRNSVTIKDGIVYVPVTFFADSFGWDVRNIGDGAWAISENFAEVETAKAVLSHLN